MNRITRTLVLACVAAGTSVAITAPSAEAEVINLNCGNSGSDIWIDFDKNLITQQWYAGPNIEYHTFAVQISDRSFDWVETEGWSYRIDRATGAFAGYGPNGKHFTLQCSKGSHPPPARKF